jgi:Ni/Co efflux regulator RcnB
MRYLGRILTASALAVSLCGGVAIAQDHHDDQDHHQQYVHHDDWKHGSHIRHEDWDRGEQVDWHSHHLKRPPSGYEWRQVDGNFVMARVSDGYISTVVVVH